jgi:hypothetical protein
MIAEAKWPYPSGWSFVTATKGTFGGHGSLAGVYCECGIGSLFNPVNFLPLSWFRTTLAPILCITLYKLGSSA